MSEEAPKKAGEVQIEDFLQELPPLNPALVQGNCNAAFAPHTGTQPDASPADDSRSENAEK